MILAAFDKNEEQIAAALSITPPTLRKHYFRELRSRLEARQRLEGKLLSALVKEVDAGNVSAVDKLFKRLDRHDLATGTAIRPARDARPPKKGKKEAAIENAIARAGKTVRNLRWFEVVQVRGHIENGKVAHYQVTLKVGFTMDDAD